MADDPQRPGTSETDASPDHVSSDITRREWLLRLGGTAVLMGLRGAPGAGQGAADPGGTDQLPPGLYYPSEDHMTHALTSDSRFLPIPEGSETDFVRPASGPFEPRFFSPADFKTVKRLVATVLGESAERGEMEPTVSEIAEWIDLEVYNSAAARQAALNLTPQHRTLAVAFYGQETVKELETADPQKTWREGLAWISAESGRRWGKAFIDVPAASQAELLVSLSRESKNPAADFYVLLKKQVADGFYTSQPGLKELDYKGNAFYADCPGCNLTKEPTK